LYSKLLLRLPAEGGLPPKLIAADTGPAPPPDVVFSGKFAPLDHAPAVVAEVDIFHSSVAVEKGGPSPPPKARVAGFDADKEPAKCSLAVDKSANSVQEVPSQDSVMPTTAVELCPPNAKPAEVVPDAAA